MHILFLTNNPNLGSTARVLQAWVLRLREDAVRCQVVCPPGDLADELKRSGTEVLTSTFPVPTRRRPWQAGVEALRIAWWARGASVIHCNEHAVYPFAAVVGWLMRRPVVCYVRFKLGRDFCEWAFGRFGAPAALLWTSYAQQRESAAAVAGLVPESRQEVLRLGLDTSQFGTCTESRAVMRQSLGLSEKAVVIGTASAIKPIKQLEDFIELVRRTRVQRPEAVGVIAGGVAPGYEDYAASLRQSTDDAAIRWIGHQKDVEPFLHGIDIFVSTSDLETFGNSVCEAMLCGKPVAAYEGGAVAEVVGDTGCIVPNGDLSGLTGQVLQLIEQPGEAARLGSAARERVRQEFDAASRIPRLLQLYDELAKGPTSARRKTAKHEFPENTQPLRVLYLTNNPNRVSTTVPTEGWFLRLRSKGLEPVLVSHEVGDFHNWALEQGIPAYSEPLPLPSKWYPWPFFAALWRLRRIVQTHGIQLIHCNEQSCYPIGSYLSKLTGLPIVVSVHFTVDRGFCAWAFGKHMPQRLYFVSEGNLRACREAVAGIVPESRWQVLNNAIDVTRYGRDTELANSFRVKYGVEFKRTIGVACALRERKQIEHLFDLAELLPDEVGIVIAGGPIPAEKEYSERLIADGKARLGSRLIPVGHQKELQPFLSAIDLFINTSREESFCISALEAMACGCPVIGYPSVAVDCVVLPGGGEITPQDNVPALASAVRRWLSDSELLEQTRRTARARAVNVFDIQRNCELLWRDYQFVMNVGGCHEDTLTLGTPQRVHTFTSPAELKREVDSPPYPESVEGALSS